MTAKTGGKTGAAAAPVVGFVVPGDAERFETRISGGYAYDRRLRDELIALGVRVRYIAAPEGPPDAASRHAVETAMRAFVAAEAGMLLVDGLAFPTVSAVAARELGATLVALVHHPLCLEDGLTDAQASTLEAIEREVVRAAHRVVTTSDATADLVADMFDLERERIAVAPPGVDPAERASCDGDPPRLVSVGAAIPRKGYLTLLEAMALLRGQDPSIDWRLDIVGPTDADPDHAAAIAARIEALGLADRVSLNGAVAPDAMDAIYRSADVFVSTATLEGYGMAAAEAVNRGLPVVAAASTILSWAPGAIAVEPPGDAAAVAAALAPLIADQAARRRAADASWEMAAGLPRWPDTARIVAEAMFGPGWEAQR